MRCKVCDYRLWNLPSRACPECGTAFRPSDYEFTPNSVQFCCPHCNQPYFGTDQKGHLVPRAFDCVQCGRHIDMDQMVLRPGEGVREEQTQQDRNPWLERRKVGWWKGWIKTVGLSLGIPTRLMRATPHGRIGEAWLFAVVSNLIYYVLGMSFLFLVFAVV